MADYAEQVREFVISNFLFAEERCLKDDESFMENHILDSTGILELVMFLENTFNIKVGDQEMLPENLDSVERIASFLVRKLDGEASVWRAL